MASTAPTSSSSFSGGLPPLLPQPPPQQATTIRRQDTRWGCSRCPGQHFARKSSPPGSRTFSSLEKHVTARHPGIHWTAVVFKWGHRLQYTDGSVYDRPLPGSPASTMIAYGPRRSRTTTAAATAATSVPTQMVSSFPVVSPVGNFPTTTTTTTTTQPFNDIANTATVTIPTITNTHSTPQDDTNTSSTNQSTSQPHTTTDPFDLECLNNQHGSNLYYLADQAFNEIYTNGQPGTLRSQENSDTAMRVYLDEKRLYVGMRLVARYNEED